MTLSAWQRLRRDFDAWPVFIGLAILSGLLAGFLASLLLPTPTNREEEIRLLRGVLWSTAGFMIGWTLAWIQRNAQRVQGLVPFAATLGAIILWGTTGPRFPSEWILALVGASAGIAYRGLGRVFRRATPADLKMRWAWFRVLAETLPASVMLLVAVVGWRMDWWTAAHFRVGLAIIVGLLAIWAWWVFRRPALENVIELVFLVLYRVRVHGPGIRRFPGNGPVFVIANHACFMDPLFLAKFIPRPLVAMMTSVFFDVPALRWLMVHFAEAIRVEWKTFRRDVPEILQAVQKLDEGKTVVIFAEGGLRRRDDLPLKRFGQGVWHILRERPTTPVVVCWIEGNWGSFFSFHKGPPLKNKRMDVRRKIDVAIDEPRTVPAEILADCTKTRQYLMEQCSNMRKAIGLEPVPVPILSPNDEEEA